jgi:hypothetical protein
VVQLIVVLIGLGRAPESSADALSGCRIVESDTKVIHLEESSPLMHTVLVGRRVERTRRMFTTVLRYGRPVLARLVWAIVSVVHRRTA